MARVNVVGYAIAGGLIVMAPGPDFAVVLRNGISGGRRSASAAGLGVASGLLIWCVAVATGLGAVLAASASVYTAIKLAGVAYLLFLGLSSLRSALRRRRQDEADDRIVQPPATRTLGTSTVRDC